MRQLRALWMRLRGVCAAREAFDAELASHIEMHIDDAMRRGLTREQARREALIALGGAEQTRQALRDRATLPWLETFARDLRTSLRALRKHPVATGAAILSLGLGVGANATIFSMVSRFVLRPAPVGEPATLLALHTMQRGDRCCNSFSMPMLNDLRAQAQSFSGIAAYYELLPASISGSGEPERIWGQGVTANFFDVSEMPMVAGRGFAASEARASVVVLGEALWRQRFHADPAIVGHSIQISGSTFTVVGIAPAAFHSIDQILSAQFWIPLDRIDAFVPGLPRPDERNAHWLQVIARLRPGATRSDAAAELAIIASRLAASHPESDKDLTFVFEQAGSLPPRDRQMVQIFLAALMAVVLLVLAIAAANVANLLFAQAVARQKEMAVRLSLGATRASIRRQILAESLLLGLGGGALGVALSLIATRGLAAFHVPAPVPLNLALTVDARVLLYSFALSVACGLLLGVGPAWAASHPRMARALKGEDALATPGRRLSLRSALVVLQVAMAVVLLSVTGLFLRSLESASRIDIGFQPRGLAMLSVDPRLNGYTPERTAAFLQTLTERAQALPSVDHAVATDVPLLSGGNRSDGFSTVDEKNNHNATADLYMVTPGFFETLGIPLVAGRDIAHEPADAPPVAVVNRAFVERMFPGANPLGQHVQGPNGAFEIVGVVGNTKSRTLGEENRPVLYRALNQSVASDPSQMGYTLVVHTSGNAAALAESLRRLVYALDPAVAVYNQETMEEHVRTAYFLPQIAATLFGTMGAMGLVLAMVGLYGVMSYAVSRRRREIGIRMALGAQAAAVQRMVLRQGLQLSLVAVALGWPVAWIAARFAASFLYGVAPHDAVTFAAVPPLVVALALAATWTPARRASTMNPMETLRAE
jgi:predicted permease